MRMYLHSIQLVSETSLSMDIVIIVINFFPSEKKSH